MGSEVGAVMGRGNRLMAVGDEGPSQDSLGAEDAG